MGGWRALRGGARWSDLFSDSAAPTANGCEAATANRRTGAQRINTSRPNKSGRAAGEGQIILGFGKRRRGALGLNCRIAAFKRSCAAFETSAEYLAGWTGGRRSAHAAAGRCAPGVLFAAERDSRC